MFRHGRLLLLALVVLCVGWPVSDVTARGGGEGARGSQSRVEYPRAPRAGYRPRLVRQLYNNCAFASAEMLIDKWTEGRRRPAQHALRRTTGIAPIDGGPTLGQLSRAVARVSGIEMRWSPNGGDAVTWPELLSRLELGGGAVINLWPAKLPAHYRRWLPALTAGHSVYIERYQRDRDRVWLMDPLGRGRGFQGEWIAAEALSGAIWRTGEHVWAAATPPPEPREPSLADFELGSPQLTADGFTDSSLPIQLTYAPRRPDARLPALQLVARWERVPIQNSAAAVGQDVITQTARQAALAADEDLPPDAPDALDTPAAVETPAPAEQPHPAEQPLRAEQADPAEQENAAAVVPVEPAPSGGLPLEVEQPHFEALSEPLVADGGSLAAEVATPSRPGDYLVTLQLRDAAGQTPGDELPAFAPIAVRLRGPLAGQVEAQGTVPQTAVQGEALAIEVSVANLGSADWGAQAEPVALSVRWAGAQPALVVPLTLSSGETAAVPLAVEVDAELGPAALRLALVHPSATVADAERLELPLVVVPAPPRPAVID